MPDFSHLDKDGLVQMVDISEKPVSKRVARAEATIHISSEVIEMINSGNIKKGNVLTTAKIAGIMAAKSTQLTIPLCHQISLSSVDIDFTVQKDSIQIYSVVKCLDKTGAEMEALHAVTIAALTIYDMCKAVDKNMVISEVSLCSKSKQSV